jgi:hypothetical protein
LGFGKISFNYGKNIENVLTCSMANNLPSRLDATLNNNAIQEKNHTHLAILELGIYF